MQDLQGKHALVCGASGGIGRAAALALAGRGASVTALARSGDRLQDLLPELLGAGADRAMALVCDLEDRAGLGSSIDLHLEHHGPVHVLVHNTGGPPAGRLLDTSEEDFLAPFQRHLMSAQLLVRRLLPGMQAAGFGRIVCITSTSLREPIPGLGVSNLIRAAMGGWAKTLSGELPPEVTINTVMPGFTDTERLASLRKATADRLGQTEAQVLADWIAGIPEGRLAQPKELGEAIAFLCSPAAAYIRGVALPVDGGRLRTL